MSQHNGCFPIDFGFCVCLICEVCEEVRLGIYERFVKREKGLYVVGFVKDGG